MDKRLDAAGQAATVVVGILIIFYAFDYPQGPLPDLLGTRGLPVLMGGFLILAGAALLARRVWTWRSLPRVVPDEGSRDEPDIPASWLRVAVAFVIVLAYAFLLGGPPFLFSTPVAVGAILAMMQVRPWWRLAATSVGFTLAAWSIFGTLLGIPI